MESYITPILLSYLDKYVRDFNPADAQVSLWSGGVTLNNLILKPDILQKELHIPFTLASGRIHELKIQVPWMKIVSEPIVISIDTIECIISHQSGSDLAEVSLEIPENVPEAPPGYALGLVRKIVNNIALRVQHLIFKYIYDDVVLSVNVNRIKADSAHADWKPGFADVSGSVPLFRRLIQLDELTLCLDKSDPDGRIRHYHEPLLYRCHLTFKVETSPEKTRVWVQGSRLAFGLCNDQIMLLQNILHNRHWSRPSTPSRVVPLAPKVEAVDDSWTAWAWSFLPAWSDPADLVVTPPPQFRTTFLSLQIESITFAFKITDGSRNRRAHSVLHAELTDAVASASIRPPFVTSVRCGARALSLSPMNRCTCGYPIAELRPKPFLLIDSPANKDTPLLMPDEENLEAYGDGDTVLEEALDAMFDKAWSRYCPALVVHLLHRRTPPFAFDVSPANIPHDFENSDWQESMLIRMKLGPTVILANADLFHRVQTIIEVITKLPRTTLPEVKLKPLTVEELDALSENIPLRSIYLHWKDVRINIAPWDHPTPVPMPPVLVQMQPHLIQVRATMPLYPKRVCAAASQLPQMSGPVWRGAQARVFVNFDNVQIFLIRKSAEEGKYSRSVGDITFRLAAKILLHPHYFAVTVPLKQGFHLTIKELHLMGSVPRIYSSAVIVSSFALRNKNIARDLYATRLIDDAMKDSQAVALDITIESFDWKYFSTNDIIANIVMLQAVRLMMHENQRRRFDTQVWILSAPEDTRSTEVPYLRVAFQWSALSSPLSLSYVGAWISPAAVCLDPIFALAISYRPKPCSIPETPHLPTPHRKTSAGSSSGRGTGVRASGGVEVHSLGTVTHSESSDYIPAMPASTHSETAYDKMIKENLSFRAAYKALRRLVCSVEISPITVYVPTQTVDAVDCDSMRGALEEHASKGGKVLGIGTGRINMNSNTSVKAIWNIISHEGPTIIPEDYEIETPLHESFPWKIKLTELVFFTLSDESAEAKCILEPLSSSAAVSFVARQVDRRGTDMTEQVKPTRQPEEEKKPPKDNKGFFKGRKDVIKKHPKSLIEFIRGPKAIIEAPVVLEKESKESRKMSNDSWINDEDLDKYQLAVYLYADTPTFALRLSPLQVNILTDALHCLIHMINLILSKEYTAYSMGTDQGRGGRTSLSEADSIQSLSQRSHKEVSSSHLISIFERPSEIAFRTMQVTVWVQLVVSRVSAQVISKNDRLLIMFEDTIMTLDLQPNYMQIKFNISSANASYSTPKMKQGRGKLLFVRDARPETNKDSNFVRCTITKAMLACLPNEWDDSTLPSRYSSQWAKMQKESVLEICAKIAALDLEIGPSALQIICQSVAAVMTCVKDPRYNKIRIEPMYGTHINPKPWNWPLVFMHCGGIKIIIPTDDEACAEDVALPVELPSDTIIFEIGKISVCPQPENPICRQSETASGSMGAEGRQYELKAKDCAITTTLWSRYIKYLQTENKDNPALAWSQKLPPFTPLLHRLDLSMIFAPPYYAANTLICGPGFELNLLSDCVFEISVGQLKLLTVLTIEFMNASFEARTVYCSTESCPYCTDFHHESSQKEDTASISLSSSSQTSRGGFLQESLEVYVTTGIVQLSLYMRDDGSEAADILRKQIYREEQSRTSSPSRPSPFQLPRSPDRSSPDLLTDEIPRRHVETNTLIPMLHIMLSQPNLFIWKRKYRNTLQASVFDAWIGIGAGWAECKITDSSPLKKEYFQSFIKTAKGTPDPATDIWPSLMTLRCDSTTTDERDTIVLEVERPICFKTSTDLLSRALACFTVISGATSHNSIKKLTKIPIKKKITPLVLREMIGTMNIEISLVQICLLAPEGAVSVSKLTGQIAGGLRPPRFITRASVKSLAINLGTSRRHWTPLLLPVTFGLECEFRWEIWRSETGHNDTPDIIGMIHFQDIEVDFRPEHLEVFENVYAVLTMIRDKYRLSQFLMANEYKTGLYLPVLDRVSSSSSSEEAPLETEEPVEYFYKDDLRSGAFKVAPGPQVPMPYQITLTANSMSWRYPHPRAVTRIIVFPTPPSMPKNSECTLEHFCMAFSQWQELARFSIPEEGYNEIKLVTEPPAAVFAQTWRVRAVGSLLLEEDRSARHNRYNEKRYKPQSNPFHRTYLYDEAPAAEMLSGALVGVIRVDSYFAPLSIPRCQLGMRITKLRANFYNKVFVAPSSTAPGSNTLVPQSRPRGSRKVLSLVLHMLRLHRQQLVLSLNSANYSLLDSMLSAFYVDSETELANHLAGPLHIKMVFSCAKEYKARLCLNKMLLKLHPARIHGLWALVEYWTSIIKEKTSTSKPMPFADGDCKTCIEPVYWLVNECTVTLLFSQEDSEEVIRLAAATKREFVWPKPYSPRLLRCSLASTVCSWSKGVSLEHEGTSELCLNSEAGIYAYVTLKKEGCIRTLSVSGRLVLANMLSQPLVYRVRSAFETPDAKLDAIAELPAGCNNLARLCGSQPTVLKLRLPDPLGTGWSGDIPLEECPRRDVPWLVKMPAASVGKFIAVWCRVVRGRNDKRLVAAIWPLYIMRSHLPLDVNITVQSSMMDTTSGDMVDIEAAESASGRGSYTQLFMPGTTGTRHTMLLEYKDYDSPVSNETVDLMYSAAGEVFKKSPVYDTIVPVLEEIKKWQKKVSTDPHGWPYSRVVSHRTGSWSAAPAQPRTDITMELVPVQCGGACSLECRLVPLALVCNATPLTLTLRTHDGAPLAAVPPCSVLAPPVAAIKKPFYISIQVKTETYVSWPLEVWMKEPGRYGEPPAGRFAVDKPVRLAIACGRKVILITLYYEIINGINIIGFTPTYIIRNILPHPIALAAIATPKTQNQLILRPRSFSYFDKMDPSRGCGRPLMAWQVRERWRGATAGAGELALYLCVSHAAHDGGAGYANGVPVAVDAPPHRRAISMRLGAGPPVAIVLTQQCVDGRTIITIATDPCPQYKITNMSSHALLLAESDANGQAKQECEGVKWRLQLQPLKEMYYSTQSYCARHPNVTALSAIPLPEAMFLFAPFVVEELEPSWSIPVSGGSGERLVSLSNKEAIKLRVELHPHSSTIYIQDVHQNEVSASDIRKRLTQGSASDLGRQLSSQESILSRTHKQCSIIVPQRRAPPERAVTISDPVEVKDNTRLFTAVNFTVFKATVNDGKTPPEEEPVENEPVTDILEPNAGSVPMFTRDTSELSNFTTPAPTKRVTVKFQEPEEEKVVPTEPQESLISRNLSTNECDSVSLPEPAVEVAESSGLKPNIKSATNAVKDSSEMQSAESNLIMPSVSFESCSSTMFINPIMSDRSIYEFEASCEGFLIELAEHVDATPLLRIYLELIKIHASVKSLEGSVNINLTEIQVENGDHSSGLYDFPVVLAGGSKIPVPETLAPLLWTLFRDDNIFDYSGPARIKAALKFESWNNFTELTEVEVWCGNFSLYIEDSYVAAVSKLLDGIVTSIPIRHQKIVVPSEMIPLPHSILLEADGLVKPLRLRKLLIAPIETCLTMHTAVHMYIALDQSRLHLNAFKCVDLMTSPQKLAHSLTLHYLSAVIFGAAWVVGGLELLGAPSSLATRVSSARGGVASVAKAAAAGALRSLTALADSLARNLDLLAGDEEHTRRAAALRRTAPTSFLAGVATGAANFALNVLGAVGGLAHHPVVGVGVGEGGAALGLRRGLVGAFAKPLSGTADLLAYAGTGLLCQAGWDPNPKRREEGWAGGKEACATWERECVRWQRQLGDALLLSGADVVFDEMQLLMLLTSKILFLADPESQTIVRQVDISSFTVMPEVHDDIIALQLVTTNDLQIDPHDDMDEFDTMNIDQATMARVAKFAGAQDPSASTSSGKIVAIRVTSKNALAIHTLLMALTLTSKNTYFRIF